MTDKKGPPERLNCRIPGCGRTRLNKNPAYYEWVCQKCYGPVPASIRHEHKSAKAAIRKLTRMRCDDMTVVEKAYQRADKAWASVVDSAAGRLPDDQVLRDMGVI